MRRFFFFFNAPAPTELYTLSLHDALPIWRFPLCFAPFHCFQQTSSTGRFHLSAQSLASALWCGDFCCTRSLCPLQQEFCSSRDAGIMAASGNLVIHGKPGQVG